MLKKYKILVIEDSSVQRMILKLNLELEPYEIVTANNGIDGINKAYSIMPDLIISDIVMPELNGYQLCHLLKNDDLTKHIPIILITSFSEKRNEFWAVEAGADKFIKKSDKYQELLGEVKSLLNKSEAESKRKKSPPIFSVEDGYIKSRINQILDRLLFESTISNRIRMIAKFAYNPSELMKRFFNLLSQLVNYSIAAVSIDQPEITLFYINIEEPCNQYTVDAVKKELLTIQKDTHINKKVKYEVFGKELISDEIKQQLNSHKDIKFQIKDQVMGSVTIKDFRTKYNDESDEILKMISKELAMLIRYVLKLEEIETIKADFTSMIVHDLRSPMAGVFGLIKLIRDEKIGSVNFRQKQMLSQVLVSINKLLNLITEVLDFSKIERGKLEIHPKSVQLYNVIEAVKFNVQVIADEKEVLIENEYPENFPLILADELRIEQVFINLLSNAIKFSEQNSSITIGAELEKEYVKIWVKDSGVGIPAEELDRIFDKYQQSSRSQKYKQKGTGLGLVVCKMVVQSHKGKIWVESTENVGSTFYFTLPIAPSESN